MEGGAKSGGLFDRALRRIVGAIRDVTGVRADTGNDLAGQMEACLVAPGGEAAARGRVAALAQQWREGDEAARARFLASLAAFDADRAQVDAALAALAAAGDDAPARIAAQGALRRALEPPRLRLLSQFNLLADGVKFLVDLRAALMPLARTDPALGALEADLRELLRGWFDVGFLELRRIDWSSPASLLEKLVRYEAVHAIQSWDDLRNRLDSDRRCYAFFHPRMPEEPLIFVEIALTRGLAGSVQTLLDADAPLLDPRQADTAIFYSISNCQRGLSGISFGNFLIKRVVELLAGEVRSLRSFATLSPIPGFRRWFDGRLGGEEAAALASTDEADALAQALSDLRAGESPASSAGETVQRLLALPGWLGEPAAATALQPVLLRQCARYLVAEGAKDGRRALDPVAHFHLSNGARIERLNWAADRSAKGLAESAGLMVNYLYDLDRIEENHEAYVGAGKRAVSASLRRLARG